MRSCLLVCLCAWVFVMCAGCGDDTVTLVEQGMTIDGDFSDWEGISAAATDPTGDASPAGADVTALYAAQDANNIYFRLDFAGKVGADTHAIRLSFMRDASPQSYGKWVWIDLDKGKAELREEWGPDGGETELYGTGQFVATENMIEVSYARSVLDLTGTWNVNTITGDGSNGDRIDDQPWINFDL